MLTSRVGVHGVRAVLAWVHAVWAGYAGTWVLVRYLEFSEIFKVVQVPQLFRELEVVSRRPTGEKATSVRFNPNGFSRSKNAAGAYIVLVYPRKNLNVNDKCMLCVLLEFFLLRDGMCGEDLGIGAERLSIEEHVMARAVGTAEYVVVGAERKVSELSYGLIHIVRSSYRYNT